MIRGSGKTFSPAALHTPGCNGEKCAALCLCGLVSPGPAAARPSLSLSYSGHAAALTCGSGGGLSRHASVQLVQRLSPSRPLPSHPNPQGHHLSTSSSLGAAPPLPPSQGLSPHCLPPGLLYLLPEDHSPVVSLPQSLQKTVFAPK